MVETLRTSPLVYPDLCVQLFDGSAATGIHGWGPSSTLPHPSHDSPDINLSDFDGINVTHMESMTSPESPNEGTSSVSKNKGGKGKGKATINAKIIEVGDEISKVARMLVEKHKEHDMTSCMEKLVKMEWGISDPRYQTAILLFGESADLRKVWLFLPTEACEMWLKNAGSKYGLM